MRALIIAKKNNCYSVQRLSTELTKLAVPHDVFLWSDIRFADSDITHIHSKESLAKYDIIIPRRINGSLLTLLAQFCTEKKITLLNREFFTEYPSFNKLDQQFYIKKLGLLGIPSTYSLHDSYEETVSLHGVPFVAKLVEGSLGREVSKISNESEFQKFITEREADGKLFLFQKLFPIHSDYRIFFLYGEVAGIIERFNNASEWRTNITASEPRVFVQNDDLQKLGETIGKTFQLDLVGIDVLQDETGAWRIIELNTLAQFCTLEKNSSLNIAKKIVEGMLKKRISS